MRWLIGSLFGTKRNMLDKLLEAGMVMLHLDARLDGVDVPPQHQSDSHLRLNVSHAFELDHFEVNENGVEAGLKFGGRRHLCRLPWNAVFAMTSHVEPVGYLWPESLPPEFADLLVNAEEMGEAQSPATPALRVVSDAEIEEPAKDRDNGPSATDDAGDGQTTVCQEAQVDEAEPLASGVAASDTGTVSDGEPEAGESSAKGDDAKGRRYGHLRVVK